MLPPADIHGFRREICCRWIVLPSRKGVSYLNICPSQCWCMLVGFLIQVDIFLDFVMMSYFYWNLEISGYYVMRVWIFFEIFCCRWRAQMACPSSSPGLHWHQQGKVSSLWLVVVHKSSADTDQTGHHSWERAHYQRAVWKSYSPGGSSGTTQQGEGGAFHFITAKSE